MKFRRSSNNVDEAAEMDEAFGSVEEGSQVSPSPTWKVTRDKPRRRRASSRSAGSSQMRLDGHKQHATSHWEKAKKFIVHKNKVGTNLYCGQSLMVWGYMVAFATAFYIGLASLWVSFYFIFKVCFSCWKT